MKKSFYALFFIIASYALVGCNESAEQNTQTNDNDTKTAIGTNINDAIKPTSSKDTTTNTDENGYQEITWEDLEVPGKGAEAILDKFQKEIDAIPEGSMKEKEVMGRLQAALDNAPVNPKLDKKKIKLPGFISPLEIDEKAGMVKEFLLVPYFGACIHVPPPPLNQTLLVKPPKDQWIKLDDSYMPFWVSGVIHAESTATKLANAGYKITDVKIDPYEEPEETEDE